MAATSRAETVARSTVESAAFLCQGKSIQNLKGYLVQPSQPPT